MIRSEADQEMKMRARNGLLVLGIVLGFSVGAQAQSPERIAVGVALEPGDGRAELSIFV